MKEKLNLENLHIAAILLLVLPLFFISKNLVLGFLGVSLVFHIYLRMLKFSFAFVELFSRKLNTPESKSSIQAMLVLKTLGAILRVIFSSFLLFLLLKGAAISLLSVALGLIIFLLSLMLFGYFQNFKLGDSARNG